VTTAESLRDRPVHAVHGGDGNDLETQARAGLPIDELAARVAGRVAESVRRADVPSARRLEKLLARHIDRGEVELVHGAWRLTALGRRRFDGLLEPVVELEAAA